MDGEPSKEVIKHLKKILNDFSILIFLGTSYLIIIKSSHHDHQIIVSQINLLILMSLGLIRNTAYYNNKPMRDISGVITWSAILTFFVTSNYIVTISLTYIEIFFLYFQWRKKHGI